MMRAHTNGDGARRLRRIRDRVAWAVLGALLLTHGALFWSWIQRDSQPGRSICCDLVGPVAERAGAAGLRAVGGGPRPWTPDRGWLPSLAVDAIDALGGDPDGLLLVGAAGILLGMLAVFDLGRRLGGPLAGVVAAAVLPCVPALAIAGRRWDVYGTQAGLLSLAAWALVCSRSLSRPLPALLFAGLSAAGAFLSPRETDGFLVVAALGAMGLGAGLRGLIQGEGPSGEETPRWRVILGGVVVVGLVAWALTTWVRFTSPEGLGYYLRETGHNTAKVDPASWAHRSAVVGRLFWRDLTPWLAIPIEAAALLWLARGKGRAEIGAWVLFPLIALSLLPKKNHYYASVLLPALPLVLGLGVAALPGRWVRRGVACAIVLVATTQLIARTDPAGPVSRAVGPVSWQGGDATWGQVFQTSDGDMKLAPDLDDRGAPSLAEATMRAWPRDWCGCGVATRTRGPGPWSAVNLYTLGERPCLPVKQGGPLHDAAVVLVSEDVRGEDVDSLTREGLPHVDTVWAGDAQVRVHARPDAWAEARCGP